MIKTILQHDECECGAVCLCMIAWHYGRKMPISTCRELTKTDRVGTNLYGIVDGAEKIGLQAAGLSGSPEELLEGIRAGEVSFPFVAHIISSDGMPHFVVVTAYHHGKFRLNDPAVGKRVLTEEEFFAQWTGNIAVFQKGANFEGGNFTKNRFLKFFSLLKGCQRKSGMILALSFLTAGIGMAGAFVFQIVIDGIRMESGNFALAQLNRIFIALIGLYLLQAGIQYMRAKLIIELSRTIDVEMSMLFYRHLMKLPISSIMLRQTGDYISRLSDAENIRQVVSEASITIILDSAMALVCGWILFHQNSVLFAVACSMVLFYIVIVALYQDPIEKSNRKAMERKDAFQAYFKESVDGIELIKGTETTDAVLEKGGRKVLELAETEVKNGMLSISQELLSGNVELIGTVLILWFGFGMVLEGSLTLGTLMTFYALLAYFTEPIKNLAELQPTIQTALVAAERLNDILELKMESENEECAELKKINEIEFQNVNFRYGNYELTLKNVSLSIRKGQKIAIVGESGSGKTSLAKLLLRFYEPEDGRVLINGKSITEWTMKSARKTISYVSQEDFFFAESVRKNLLLGKQSVREEDIEKACRITGAKELIEKLPFGYETPIDENGRNLSGGQRQKLAIARALLREPQVLILDEATSHLDAVAEEKIRMNLFEECKDLTCIIIAHRLSMAKDCDEIFVMKDGVIVQNGSHAELIKEDGLYQKMWNSQN